MMNVGPSRFLEREEVTERSEPPLQQPLRLALLRGDQPHHVLVETLRGQVGVEIAVEPERVLPLDKCFDDIGH